MALMATETYREEGVVKLLSERQGTGTQKDLAEAIGVSQPYLCRVMNGREAPGPAILNFLGLEVTYTRATEKAA